MRIRYSNLKKLIQEALQGNSQAPGLFITVRDTNIDISKIINVNALVSMLDDLLGPDARNYDLSDSIAQNLMQSLDKDINEIVDQAGVNADNSMGVPELQSAE